MGRGGCWENDVSDGHGCGRVMGEGGMEPCVDRVALTRTNKFNIIISYTPPIYTLPYPTLAVTLTLTLT